jgi:hypothetical protein
VIDHDVTESSPYCKGPGIGAEFGMHKKVVRIGRLISVMTFCQASPRSRQAINDDRYRETEIPAFPDDTTALLKGSDRPFHVFQRVRMQNDVEFAITVRQGVQVDLGIVCTRISGQS